MKTHLCKEIINKQKKPLSLYKINNKHKKVTHRLNSMPVDQNTVIKQEISTH